ncbi:MAG: HD domain-containing protein, partial [Candidatus Thermoplasmatota archaeon]|nr:HD domain-containing protein [Candidatus Thermoplasmatota archaeon]
MTQPSPEDRRVLDFLFEQGQLKRIPRSGWFRAGIDEPESVADHTLRAAQLAYILAEMEGHPDPARVCAMVVFHEIGETRVGDVDRIAKRYVQRAEEAAAKDQLEALGSIGEGIFELWRAVEEKHTPGGIIAKDADKLEAALT